MSYFIGEFNQHRFGCSNDSDIVIKTTSEYTSWISCFGKLSHLCGNLLECQDLISRVEKVDAPQPDNLLGELLDVVERVCDLSTSLLSNTHQALAGINSQEKTTEFLSTKFTPINCDPGCRRRILTDKDRTYMIQQGPFQPRLKSYPRNIKIAESKQFHFSSEWYNSYPHLEYSIYERCCILFCLSGIFIWDGNPKADKVCDAWTVDGVQAWNKMKSRGKGNAGKLSQHFVSSGHKAALNAFLAFQNMSSHLDLLLHKERRKVLIEEEAELQHNREAINSFAPVPIKFRSNMNGAFFVAMATLKDVRACILFSLIANRIAKLEILIAGWLLLNYIHNLCKFAN